MDAVLLTGGAGYVGSHAAKRLSRAGYLPIVYDDLSTGVREAVKWGPLEVGSVTDTARLTAVLRDHSPVAVMHFAACANVGESASNPLKYYRHNVTGTLCLLEAMRDAGASRLIFSSSCSVYGVPEGPPITEETLPNPVNPYGRSKWMAEQALADHAAACGLRFACLRFFNAAGADPEGEIGERPSYGARLIPGILEVAAGKKRIVPLFGNDYPTRDGTCVRDYVHVSDLAEAHVLALRHLLEGGGSVRLNLGSGRGYSVKEVIAVAERVTGKCMPTISFPRRTGDPPELVADPRRALEVLGWKPRHASLELILDTAWRWRAAQFPGREGEQTASPCGAISTGTTKRKGVS